MVINSVNDVHSISDLKFSLTDMKETEDATDDITKGLETLSFDDPVLRAMRLRDVAIGKDVTTTMEQNENDFLPAASAPFSSKAWVLDNCSPDTLPQTLDAEMRRLLVLRSYLLLDTKEDTEAMGFDAITRLASRMLDCPIAVVSLSDMDRLWFLSQHGLGDAVSQVSRKNALCAYALLDKQEDVFVVTDASQDLRFQDNHLVTGPLQIRFYAGAPLISPEGYKLGTLCVLGPEARPEGLTLEDKHNLRDLADMVVETMARRRKEKIRAHFHNPQQTIAQMAHELLTPLMGVQLNLSTLAKDETLTSKMSPDENELLQNAMYCSDAVSKICKTAIDELKQQQESLPQDCKAFFRKSSNDTLCEEFQVKTANLIQAWYVILETFPKNVPVSITMDPSVPKIVCVDELKVFRSALNYLSNACQRTLKGSIQLTVRLVGERNQTIYMKDNNEKEEDNNNTKKERPYLFVECIDTAPNIPVENYPLLFHPSEYYEEHLECIRPTPNGGCEPICRMQTQGLGLYSVAVQIGSIGGQYGYKPRVEVTKNDVKNGEEQNDNKNADTTNMQGSIFWFKVPVQV